MSAIPNTKKLAGKTLFITGASRGIGKAIAMKAAQDGANIVIAAKTAEPHPKLDGTIYTAAKEIEAAGGQALPCIVDIRFEDQVKAAVQKAVERFGGIDILVNNASAISLSSTQDTDMKRFDLMHSINTRGTFLVSKECLPHLLKSNHAHILNISAPLNMSKYWFSSHLAYTMAKYGMSMCILGLAEEFKGQNIAINALWPQTGVHTAASEFLIGADSRPFNRKPEVMSDAAYCILSKDPQAAGTGQFLIDEDVLRSAGIENIAQYAYVPENDHKLRPDIFIGPGPIAAPEVELLVNSLPEPTGSIQQLIKILNKRLSSAKPINNVEANFIFTVRDAKFDKWHLNLKTGSGLFGRGESSHIPDVLVSTDTKTLYNLLSGKLKPQLLLKVSRNVALIAGDSEQLLRLENLFVGHKSKL